MKPNPIVRVFAGFAIVVLAFALTGCQGEARPRPPKSAKTDSKPGKPAPAGETDVPEAPTPVPPETPATPVVIVAGTKGDRAIASTMPIVVKKIEEKIASKTTGVQPAIRLISIRSKDPHRTKELAIADALNVARIELMKQLEQLDPPVHSRPSMVTMRTSYLKGEPREILPTEEEKSAIRANNLNPNVRWVEIDLELTEDHVQRLRSAERVSDAFRLGALIMAFVAALYGFLRLDQWTKGYLTLWLGLGAGVLVVVVGLMVFM